MMRVCIVHDSTYGNGKQVADTLGKVFEEGGATVTVSHVRDLPAASLRKLTPDLLIVGAAIRKFVASAAVKRWMRGVSGEVKRSGRPVPRGAVFLTHGLPVRIANGWGNRLVRRLSRSGICGEVYPTWISGRVADVQGPLADGVLDAVREHGSKLREWMPQTA